MKIESVGMGKINNIISIFRLHPNAAKSSWRQFSSEKKHIVFSFSGWGFGNMTRAVNCINLFRIVHFALQGPGAFILNDNMSDADNAKVDNVQMVQMAHLLDLDNNFLDSGDCFEKSSTREETSFLELGIISLGVGHDYCIYNIHRVDTPTALYYVTGAWWDSILSLSS